MESTNDNFLERNDDDDAIDGSDLLKHLLDSIELNDECKEYIESKKWQEELEDLDWLSIKELGNDYYRAKNWSKAAACFLRAAVWCQENEGKATCFGNLAATYFAQERYHEAIENCNQSLTYKPG